jgi:ABC-type transport system involved in multi-copper enzyme maturation permease subunit
MLIWVPWSLCLIALFIEGKQPFEYRPLLSFNLMLLCTGAGFLGMGLFFSSLTRNQIIAFVLTAMGMLVMTAIYFIKWGLQREAASGAASNWIPVLTHISYIEVWVNSGLGQITPKLYLFHISAAIFWLFATIKVLESRRWR